MEKIKKEKVLQTIRNHIKGLLITNNFLDMARFYCEIASKIFENKPVEKDYLAYLNEDLYDVDKQIMNYVREINKKGGKND